MPSKPSSYRPHGHARPSRSSTQGEGIEDHEDCPGEPAASPYAPQQQDVYSGPEDNLAELPSGAPVAVKW
jgi:hypothetical protein